MKSLGVEGKGAAAALKEIEIEATSTGPKVVLHGDALTAAKGRKIVVSISHDAQHATAYAVLTSST
jgi:fatty acid synthase subunit alpha, fungi type